MEDNQSAQQWQRKRKQQSSGRLPRNCYLETVSIRRQRDSISLREIMVLRVRNSESRFQVVLKTQQSRRSLGSLLQSGCASTLESHPFTPRHTWRHTDDPSSHLSSGFQRTISDFIIPLVACTSMPSSQAFASHHSPDLNDCPHNIRNSYLYMHLCMF